MAIPAISFAVGRNLAVPRRMELDPGTLAGTKDRVSDEGAAACVVRARDLDSFRGQKDLVVDRGRKPERKELAALLLGYGRVPVIAGSYRSGGQLRRSVRTLLERAAARGERNLFIIGAADAVFDTLWELARPTADAPASDAETILDLLPAGRVPEDLERKFIGTSLQARLVRRLIMRASAQDDPVLIVGDTGTGKEVVARAIHEYSRRRVETFVSVNCAAIPQDLFESELFGHEPESFTGAVHRKPGLWKVADRGTLFLDEIGDLRPDHQAKILRSLQEGTIRPVGAVKEVPVNARVLTATNRDLFAMVQAGRFREDLYYRLRSFFIPTPALESHPEDIPLLAQSFWRAITRDPGASLSDPVVEALAARDWPGNARELRAVLSNLHGLFGKARIGVEHLAAVSRLQSGVAGTDLRAREAGAGHRVECLRHLRRAADVVAASEATVRQLVEGEGRPSPALRRSFRHRLSELEMVSLRPALFADDVVFQVVARLRDAFREADARLHAEPGARHDWARTLDPALKLAVSAVLREIQRLGSE
jgi:DNA-binding NtrC family response regulator